ncbi:DUF4851 domain-containing protein [Desulfovibrio sp. OttesenSCG-928-A18]|nr:DUF4851 domain-containing protein [Desulfovibrio sp. OttesenSCG-928-A18]
MSFRLFRRVPVFSMLLAALLLLTAISACSPRQKGSAAQNFYVSGLANIEVTVNPPLSLVANGDQTVTVPTESSTQPGASFTYAVFSDSDKGPVNKHVHAIFSELPRALWEWKLETWALPEAFFYDRQRMAGKSWTMQILPVIADQDWFSALYRENGRETPEFWLAKRWSATPRDEMRMAIEYREPAPQCMHAALRAFAEQGKEAAPGKGREFLRGCDDEVNAFVMRADSALQLDRLAGIPAQPMQLMRVLPKIPVNVDKLLGTAQRTSKGGSHIRD